MKYYLVVGEASADLHASHLMKAILENDPQAVFRFIGGDLMVAVGGELVRHYRDLAYMGIFPVLLHLRTIFANMAFCKRDIEVWKPDVLILVDYPGFNFKIAKYIRAHTSIPIYYYIAPKIWAWKEYRIKAIKRDITKLFSILPFEVDFFEKKHNYPICYVGNPTLDEVTSFLDNYHEDFNAFIERNALPTTKPIIAVLAGSRKQEIQNNLARMLEATSQFPDYQVVIAGAPSISPDFYNRFIHQSSATIVFGETYPLLKHAKAALVTSGTATLETAIFKVPQVVCYFMKPPRLVSWIRPYAIRVKFISLVNLIANKEVVKELVAADMTVSNVIHELQLMLENVEYRDEMLLAYEDIAHKLGAPGAPMHAAAKMMQFLKES